MPSVDSDLMRFFDDELDENEIAELEAALASDEASWLEAEAKLDGLDLVRGLLIEAVDEDTRADGIADDVMAKLEVGEKADAPLKLPLQKSPRAEAPANDNSRTLWTLAAAAAAVAAGMFIWGNADVDVDPIASAPPPLEAPAQTAEPAEETLGDAPGAAPHDPPQVAGNASDEDEDAVEIAQLDFGAHSGSIFKVDNDSTGVHTAVVWVNDSGDDE